MATPLHSLPSTPSGSIKPKCKFNLATGKKFSLPMNEVDRLLDGIGIHEPSAEGD